MLESGEDMYSHIQPVKALQKFVKSKNIDEVYVCSKAEPAELKSKMAFCIREYGIMPDHIKCVRKKSDKVVFLDGLSEKLGIPQCNIALVEDTVETLDSIAQTRDYFTINIGRKLPRIRVQMNSVFLFLFFLLFYLFLKLDSP